MTTIKATRNDTDIVQASNSGQGFVTMNSFGHLYVDIKSMNGEIIAMNSGNISDSTQRVCIATDDIPSIITQNYLVDGRLNPNYRHKICGGYTSVISNSNYQIIGPGVNANYVDVSPPLKNMHIISSSTDDDASGIGCRSVYLKYIDSSKDLQEISVETNGTTSVSIGTNIREVIEFKCATFGSTGHNVGTISLLIDDDEVLSNIISATLNNSLFFGIEIPQNGYTLLKSLTIASMENTNPDIDIEVQLILAEAYTSIGFLYRTIFIQRCKYQQSIKFDLSDFPPILGSSSPNYNFVIYPVAKAIGSSSTSGQIFLTAINVNAN